MIHVEQVTTAIERVRVEAVLQFGWTHLELVAVALPGSAVALHGTIAAHGLLARVRRECGPGVVLDVSAVEVLTTGRFVAVPEPGIGLYRRPDRVRDDELATELDPGDGPVEWLTELGDAHLVRASDGTVGWTRATLASVVARPQFLVPAHADTRMISTSWAAWLGVTYRMGGTRDTGVDCSGLVQRLLASASLRCPRHSTDQLAIDPQPDLVSDLGTIVAIWSDDEAPCHVGLAVGGGRIVHASRSRGLVVVQTDREFAANARRVAHVPLAGLVELQHRAQGQADLLAVLRPLSAG